MSEKEIIKMLKDYSATNPFQKNMFYVHNLHEAIQGILDLYNKEKEENKKLSEKVTQQIIDKVEVEVLEKLRKELDKEKEKNKELEKENLELHTEIAEVVYWESSSVEQIKQDYIPKSKVREKIEEIDEILALEPVGNKLEELLTKRKTYIELLQKGGTNETKM